MSDKPSREAEARDAADPSVGRRRLLRLLIGGSTVAASALLGVPVASYLRPLEPDEGEAVALLAEGEVPLWEAKRVVISGRPVLVVNTGEGYQAISAVCTHLGCIVKWKKGRREFFCPCHGARFAIDGRVIGGPAPRPLPKLDVKEIAGTIVVRKA